MTDDKVRNSFETSGDNLQGNIQGNQGNIGYINQNYVNNHYQAPVIDEQTKAEFYGKKELRKMVKKRWIEGFLYDVFHPESSEKSLPMIKLVLEERPDAVKPPFQQQEVSRVLPTGMSEFEVFDQIGAGQTLLILGESGAGKTITLLKLAEDLIDRAEKDESLLIPVVFNLCSWRSKDKNQEIADWLIKELEDKYKAHDFGKTWIDKKQLILLLDGLDEVKADLRKACVQKINEFIKKYGPTKVVVCSNIEEYEDIGVKLEFEGAIFIRPLTSEQVNEYLDNAVEKQVAVKSLLQQDTKLQELAMSPLMLSILTQACQGYQGKTVEHLSQKGSLEELTKDVFDVYIERMFSKETDGKPREYKLPYLNPQTKQWLTWLAQKMEKASQKEFFIEQMQPTWLGSKAQYLFGNMLIGGSILGLTFGLIAFLSAWVTCKTCTEDSIKWAGINGIIAFVFFGLVLGWGKADIKTVETIKWSWQEAKNSLLFGGIIAILVWLLLIFALSLWYGIDLGFSLDNIVFRSSALGGIIAGLSYVLSNALKGPAIQTKTYPNQGIWVSLKSAIIIVLIISVPLIMLILFRIDRPNIGSRFGLRWAMFLGLGFGGGADCIKHFTLRFLLHRNNYIPWNYARFLDYASERSFLKKVGGGYIFVHGMLQKHFARMK